MNDTVPTDIETSRKAELILNHREHPTDKSPIPERWSPELHKEYLKKTELGIEPDPYELMEQLSKQRADFYADRSAVYHEAQKKKEATQKAITGGDGPRSFNAK